MFNKSVPDICGWVSLAGEYRQQPSLCGKQTADWVVVGGGFTGLSAARRIAELEPNARILLVEGKSIAQGASGRNSGFVVANESASHATLSTARGRDDYMSINSLDHAGIDELKEQIKKHKIKCQWEDTGSIHAATSPQNFGKLHHHAQAFSDMGINARLMDENALRKRLGTDHYKLGVLSDGGAFVQPAALAKGLVSSLPEQVEIFENSPVLEVKADGDGVMLTLERGGVRTKKVIVAVNAFMPRLGFCRNRVFPLALSASLTRKLTEEEEEAISYASPWGVLSPQALGATVRLTKDRRLLIRNTVEYKPSGIGSSTLHLRRKKHYEGLNKRFPWLVNNAIEYTWSGSICVSRNSKPVFENISGKIFMAGCYNAAGISRGTIMGKLIVDLALGEQSNLLSKALSIGKPSWIPSRLFFDFGAKAKIALERVKGRSES